MTRKSFVNLPVKDLRRSLGFFAALGFRFDPRLSDDAAACMVVNDGSFVMLLTEPAFRRFTTKELADTARRTEVVLSVSVDRRDEVDELVNRAFMAGARPSLDPVQHEGVYSWGFEDLDGHLWEVLWTDPDLRNGRRTADR